MINAGIITVSDTRSTGENIDTVGPMLVSILRDSGYNVEAVGIVPDEKIAIAKLLVDLVDERKCDLVITTGGTGLAPRDVTPDATRMVIDYEIPGIAEMIRVEGGKQTNRAWLSRAIAGARKSSLIINVPGSERGAKSALETVLPILNHAIETLRGDTRECGVKASHNETNS